MWRTYDKFWPAPIESSVYFEAKIEKLYPCEIITFNKFCATPHKCYMRINKQLIKLVYNDVKNLAYSFMCSNGVQSVFWSKDRKAFSVWDNNISQVSCNSS